MDLPADWSPRREGLSRSPSRQSSASSNIVVAHSSDPDHAASEQPATPTPPTSVAESGSMGSGKASVDSTDAASDAPEPGRRSRRVRSGVSTYSLRKPAGAARAAHAQPSRDVSGLTGRTLVNGREEEEEEELLHLPFNADVDKAMHMDWELSPAPELSRPARKTRHKPSVKDRVKEVVEKVGSVLGKRKRETAQAGTWKGKGPLGKGKGKESPKRSKILRELDLGKKGVLDEIDLDADFGYKAARQTKKQKTGKELLPPAAALAAAPLQKTSDGRKIKKWQTQGLYVGQKAGACALQSASRKKLETTMPGTSAEEASRAASTAKHSFISLPMFNYLDSTRDFVIPYDVFAPTAKKRDEKPKDWVKLNRNRIVGDAKDIWDKTDRLGFSACVCRPPAPGEQGCGDDCLNRVMSYECNENNCVLGRDGCGNRSFADLAARVKKGGAFDLGVELVKTPNRGFGVRSCRSFAPGQIIMEYTGEIISEEECERRIHEDYKDKQCYYLMQLERGLVIDGTKGSMARFINHSCAPNCEVRMMKVNGTPRMAVFAGDDGVMAGEELTYDYNFDNFGSKQQICYCGADTCRGFLSKRLNAVEQKKFLKEEVERKRKVAEQAQKIAEAQAKKKQIKRDRGAGWLGWVAVDDPEVKERLRAEKKAKEEADMSSSRARRLAARQSSPQPDAARKSTRDLKRRRTVGGDELARKTKKQVSGDSPGRAGTRSRFSEGARTKATSSYSPAAKRFIHSLKLEQNDQADDDADDADDEIVLSNTNNNNNNNISVGLSKSKEVMKNVGQAIKDGFMARATTRRASPSSSSTSSRSSTPIVVATAAAPANNPAAPTKQTKLPFTPLGS